MTEQEAIKEIHRICCNEPQYYQRGERKCNDKCMYGENLCVFQTAIKALEEVQEYRKIGSVEEVKNQKENLNVAYQIISDYEQYGTIEDFKEAKKCMRLLGLS